MDILEAAPDRQDGPRLPRAIWRAAAGLTITLVVVAVVIGALAWWRAEGERPDRLEVVSAESIGPFAITGEDLPDDWPRGLVVGAMLLRLDITADPQRSTSVAAAGDAGSYIASGARDVPIPAGERLRVSVVVNPGDCGATVDADVPPGPLIDAAGNPVPMAPSALRVLEGAIDSLCSAGGQAPDISPRSARVDVFFRDRTLVMRVRVRTDADRVVLQPRDSIGFRGRGEQEATIEDGVATSRLRWLVSPAETVGLAEPAVRIRAFAVSAGRAYPWVLDLRVPEGAAIPAPSRPRNDGVDLAEVAPRPTS